MDLMSDRQTKERMWSCKGDSLEGIWGELECGDGLYVILIDYIYVWNSLEKKKHFKKLSKVKLHRDGHGMSYGYYGILVLLNCLILSVKFKRHYFSIVEAS